MNLVVKLTEETRKKRKEDRDRRLGIKEKERDRPGLLLKTYPLVTNNDLGPILSSPIRKPKKAKICFQSPNPKKAKKEKRKNLFNLLPKASIFDSDALGMIVVVLDSNRERESLREGTLKRRIGGKRVR